MFSRDTLFELYTAPPSSRELCYTGMLRMAYSEGTASFIIHIQLSSETVSS